VRPRRLISPLLASFAVLSLLTGCTSAPETLTATPADTARAAAESFLDRYVEPDGRVVRLDQGGDTVSEGQAYG